MGAGGDAGQHRGWHGPEKGPAPMPQFPCLERTVSTMWNCSGHAGFRAGLRSGQHRQAHRSEDVLAAPSKLTGWSGFRHNGAPSLQAVPRQTALAHMGDSFTADHG